MMRPLQDCSLFWKGNQRLTRSRNGLVTFDDIAVRFSEEEWNSLHDQQKELYREVMQDNYQNLTTLGFVLNKPEIVMKIEKGEDPCASVSLSPERVQGNMAKHALAKQVVGETSGTSGLKPPLGQLRSSRSTSGSAGQGSVENMQTPHVKGQKAERSPLVWKTAESPTKFRKGQGVLKDNISSMDGPSPLPMGHSAVDGRGLGSNIIQVKSPRSKPKKEASDQAIGTNVQGKSTVPRNGMWAEHYVCKREDNAEENVQISGLSVGSGKPYRCARCGEGWNNLIDFLSHEVGSCQDRPYSCNICSKTFVKKQHLSSHRKIHTEERPFTCPQCGRSFRQSSTLTTHLWSHAGHKPFHCSCCTKSFSRKTDLVAHMRRHTGERPYECPYCWERFIRKKSLQRHLRKHVGESLRTVWELNSARLIQNEGIMESNPKLEPQPLETDYSPIQPGKPQQLSFWGKEEQQDTKQEVSERRKDEKKRMEDQWDGKIEGTVSCKEEPQEIKVTEIDLWKKEPWDMKMEEAETLGEEPGERKLQEADRKKDGKLGRNQEKADGRKNQLQNNKLEEAKRRRFEQWDRKLQEVVRSKEQWGRKLEESNKKESQLNKNMEVNRKEEEMQDRRLEGSDGGDEEGFSWRPEEAESRRLELQNSKSLETDKGETSPKANKQDGVIKVKMVKVEEPEETVPITEGIKVKHQETQTLFSQKRNPARGHLQMLRELRRFRKMSSQVQQEWDSMRSAMDLLTQEMKELKEMVATICSARIPASVCLSTSESNALGVPPSFPVWSNPEENISLQPEDRLSIASSRASPESSLQYGYPLEILSEQNTNHASLMYVTSSHEDEDFLPSTTATVQVKKEEEPEPCNSPDGDFYSTQCYSKGQLGGRLPNINMLPLSTDREWSLLARSGGKPGRFAALVFRALVPFDIYKGWVNHVNLDGLRGRRGIPMNVKRRVMGVVERHFTLRKSDHSEIRNRLNEQLRTRRKSDIHPQCFY